MNHEYWKQVVTIQTWNLLWTFGEWVCVYMYILRVTSTPVYNIPHIWRQQDNSTFDLPLSSCVRNLILTHSFVVDFYLDIFFVTPSDVWVSVTPSSLRSGMLWRNVSDLARLHLQNDSMNSTGSHLMIIDISRLMATGAREIPPEGLPRLMSDWVLIKRHRRNHDVMFIGTLGQHLIPVFMRDFEMICWHYLLIREKEYSHHTGD